MTILINILLAIWSVVAILMVFVILMQRPKSEGLGAAFGGGVTENIFGAQTTNVLVKFTGWLAGIFFILTFFLSVLYAHRSKGDPSVRREILKEQNAAAGVVTPAPAQSPAAAAQPGASGAPVATPASGAAVGVVPPATTVPVPAASATAAPAATAAPSP